MKREIKFRGKRDYDGKWVEGYLSDKDKINVFEYDSSVGFATAENYEVIPESVGQSTVLKDKNGKEIFEGDIIYQTLKRFDIEPSGYEVIWNDAGFSLIHAKRHGDKYGMFTRNFPLHQDVYEVIGNIYDNPELLKSK